MIGTTADEGITSLGPYINGNLKDVDQWKIYKDSFNETASKALLNIPHPSDITPSDIEKLNEFLAYYIKSFDNIDFEHLKGRVSTLIT